MTVNEEIVESFKDVKIGSVFSMGEIKDLVYEKYGRNRNSVIPSDLCYNSSNWGVENSDYHSKVKRLFLKIDSGMYKYVGPDFDATGVNQYEFGTVSERHIKEIILETKLVGSIVGKYFVPSYQRGYRWGEEEVKRLLNDIYMNGSNNYCLQPIVVRKREDGYELIDGQQRLTTLYILLSFIKKEFKPRIDLKFELTYETREKSEEFLKNIDETLADSNIDFYHIFKAYKTIEEWFATKEDDVVVADDIYGYLVKFVKVIWYEVDENEDAIALFARLNIGKIPLTSAELVKAIFLCRNNNKEMNEKKQEEISLQWDSIEKELHQDSLWYFLTNSISKKYQTRIDLVLDLMAKKPVDSKDKYYTFFKFDEMRNGQQLDDIWREIQKTFLLLKDWYENHELYHKIGYLIASKSKTLQEIYDLSVDKSKTAFKASLDSLISESIDYEKRYEELSYDKSGDYDKISRLLLLFNVESVRQIDENAQRFPFDKFKEKTDWSLEHIHAQQSEGMRKQEEWKSWLGMHIDSLKAVGGHDELVAKMQEAKDREVLDRTDFRELQEQAIDALSVEGNAEYLHSISNLALLNSGDNAALNNSTFDVKRNIIVDMDKKGKFIPFCTKMVFLKYYTPSEYNDIHFWGQKDRIAYVQAINTVLKKYLNSVIEIEREVEG